MPNPLLQADVKWSKPQEVAIIALDLLEEKMITGEDRKQLQILTQQSYSCIRPQQPVSGLTISGDRYIFMADIFNGKSFREILASVRRRLVRYTFYVTNIHTAKPDRYLSIQCAMRDHGLKRTDILTRLAGDVTTAICTDDAVYTVRKTPLIGNYLVSKPVAVNTTIRGSLSAPRANTRPVIIYDYIDRTVFEIRSAFAAGKYLRVDAKYLDHKCNLGTLLHDRYLPYHVDENPFTSYQQAWTYINSLLVGDQIRLLNLIDGTVKVFSGKADAARYCNSTYSAIHSRTCGRVHGALYVDDKHIYAVGVGTEKWRDSYRYLKERKFYVIKFDS